MFRAIRIFRDLGCKGTIILILIIIGGAVIYEVFFPSGISYTLPAGYIVTTRCITGGRDCDEYGSVLLWDDLGKSSSRFSRASNAIVHCIATMPKEYKGESFWWIDCGIWYGVLERIEGWVQEENLKFGKWVESQEIKHP
jgi:hypothetical protein